MSAPDAAPPASTTSAARADALWLGAILVLALVLRAVGLNASLWFDEIVTLVNFTRPPLEQLVTTYPSLNHHVLYSVEAKAALAVFGESAWALRLPAMLFGVASVWALWLVAKEVVSRWEARLATLLLAVSYHHVWFSQNARGYTSLLFFALVGTWLFLRGRQRASLGHWSLYGVVVALALYTHLTAGFFFAAHALVYAGLALHGVLLRKRGGPATAGRDPLAGPWPLYGLAFGALLALALYAPLLRDLFRTFNEYAAPDSAAAAAATAKWNSPLWTLLEIGRSFGALASVAALIVLPVLALGAWSLLQRAPVLTAIALVHVPLTFGLLLLAHFKLWPRYFFVDIGFVCLFLVRGAFVAAQHASALLARMTKMRPDPVRLGALLASAGIAASLVMLPANYRYPKQDLLGARDFVEAERARDAAVVTIGRATFPYAEYYAPRWSAVASVDALERLVQSGRDVWVVYAFPALTERRYKELTEYVAARFERVRRFHGTLGDGDVLVFRFSR